MDGLDTPWMTANEAAQYARASIDTIRDALAAGELRGSQRKPGGRWRVHREDIDAWIRGEPPTPFDPPRVTRN